MVQESVVRKVNESAGKRYRAFGIDTPPAFGKMKLPECAAKQTATSCLIPAVELKSMHLNEMDRCMGRSK